MTEGNDIVLETLLDDVLDESILVEAIDEALRLLQGDERATRLQVLESELGQVARERDRLVAAIAASGHLPGLLTALQTREAQWATLDAERVTTLRAQAPLRAREAGRVRDDLRVLSSSWRRVLADDPTHARPIVSSLLKGRVTFMPLDAPKTWELRGVGTLAEVFQRVLVQGVIRPQRETCSLTSLFSVGNGWIASTPA